MNKIAFWVILLIAWLGAGAYWHTCKIRYLCGCHASATDTVSTTDSLSGAGIPSDGSLTPVPFSLMQDGKALFSFPDGIFVRKGDGKIYIPEASRPLFDSIYSFMKLNTSSALEITGLYGANENNGSSFENLGLARANDLRDSLIARGCNPDRLTVNAKDQNLVFSDQDRCMGGIELSTAGISPELEAKVEAGIAHKLLYFPSGKTDFIGDPTLEAYSLELKEYMKKYPGKMVEVVGHTDDVGPSDGNVKYGRMRANKVKDFFVNGGMPAKKFQVISKGESEPIADNSTPEGAAKNRRVEVIVK